MVAFDAPVLAVECQESWRIGGSGGMVGDAVDGFGGGLSGLFVEGMAFDGEYVARTDPVGPGHVVTIAFEHGHGASPGIPLHCRVVDPVDIYPIQYRTPVLPWKGSKVMKYVVPFFSGYLS